MTRSRLRGGSGHKFVNCQTLVMRGEVPIIFLLQVLVGMGLAGGLSSTGNQTLHALQPFHDLGHGIFILLGSRWVRIGLPVGTFCANILAEGAAGTTGVASCLSRTACGSGFGSASIHRPGPKGSGIQISH